MPEESNKPEVSRRDFLKTGAGASAGLAALSSVSFFTRPEKIFGANDRVRVAICGVHGRGFDHVENYAKIRNAEIAAICDIDENVAGQRVGEMEKKGIPRPKIYYDVRKLLEDKSIDAISIATPNHWHTLMAIWGCQAGKDVYVEKPCSHNLWEGRQLVQAANRYNRIVQHGTQSRSSKTAREAIERVHNGEIGEIYLSRGLCYKWRDTIGRAPVAPVPAGVHYDLWTGPAPEHAFTHNRFHYNWHWFWYYGNGDLGNQGIHQVDVARWGLGLGFPNRATALGGHFMFDDDQETPNTVTCAFEYDMPDGKTRMLEFEVRHWITNGEAVVGAGNRSAASGDQPKLGPLSGTHNAIGNLFYGSKGYIALADGDEPENYRTWLGKEQRPGTEGRYDDDEVVHFQNFVDCVVSRKKEDLNAPIEEGHMSCALVHLANASYRLKRTVNFNPETQEVVGDEEAAELVRDGGRGYRAPFTVPEEV
ncbi:MAG TPA: Gfo/Idh/MocA family oxidoreductase [Terriglobia bacterium]|nr:Gfo/Idh/MocA family oxidoreductase [Terriglobia bacterium]